MACGMHVMYLEPIDDQSSMWLDAWIPCDSNWNKHHPTHPGGSLGDWGDPKALPFARTEWIPSFSNDPEPIWHHQVGSCGTWNRLVEGPNLPAPGIEDQTVGLPNWGVWGVEVQEWESWDSILWDSILCRPPHHAINTHQHDGLVTKKTCLSIQLYN